MLVSFNHFLAGDNWQDSGSVPRDEFPTITYNQDFDLIPKIADFLVDTYCRTGSLNETIFYANQKGYISDEHYNQIVEAGFIGNARVTTEVSIATSRIPELSEIQGHSFVAIPLQGENINRAVVIGTTATDIPLRFQCPVGTNPYVQKNPNDFSDVEPNIRLVISRDSTGNDHEFGCWKVEDCSSIENWYLRRRNDDANDPFLIEVSLIPPPEPQPRISVFQMCVNPKREDQHGK